MRKQEQGPSKAQTSNVVSRGLFGIRKRQVLPYPLNDDSPWFFTAGPVFFPGGNGAILNDKYSKPQESLFGYAYRVAFPNSFNVNQGPRNDIGIGSPVYAPKSMSIVGVNIQTGWMGVTTPAVNSDGTFAAQSNFPPESGVLTSESGSV